MNQSKVSLNNASMSASIKQAAVKMNVDHSEISKEQMQVINVLDASQRNMNSQKNNWAGINNTPNSKNYIRSNSKFAPAPRAR